MMVVATNESSFGDGPASDQLIGMVRVSAAAIGQDLAHAAITGKSTFIEADGSVGEKTPLFEATVLRPARCASGLPAPLSTPASATGW